MLSSSRPGRLVIGFMVFVSGATGLIYQVIWHRYFTILLGAQARATAIVLAIFLGGISAGYACFGRWSRDRDWNLLMAYSAVELGLGLWAYAFPYVFRVAHPLTSHLYALLGVNSIWIDIFVSILLLFFPTFLMGGTLPLLTQGLSEDLGAASRTHARIYGLNTVGACLGSLVAGYILVPDWGLPLTSLAAGTLNVAISVGVYFLFAKQWKRGWAWNEDPEGETGNPSGETSVRTAVLCFIGFFSGLSIITLETVFIRLIGLSSGSSNYNFTLIVSIFIFGLGFGSLMVRRISRFSEKHLLGNQLGVSFSLFALYLSVNHWPYWVHRIRILFRDIPQSFYVYQAALGIGLFLLLALPVGLCGLTLPYCFHLLKDRRATLGARVGQLYSLNTVGCVMGALLGGYALLSFFNLDQIFKLCVLIALVNVALAGYLYSMRFRPSVGSMALSSSAFAIVCVGVFVAPLFIKERFFQPFRAQTPTPSSFSGPEAFAKSLAPTTSYLAYKDGRNTSVGVGVAKRNGEEFSRTIFVNGKSDGNTTGDFLTMNLTGQIPALLSRKLDRVAVVGFGTGITTGAIAHYPETGRIDVAEISSDVIEFAHYFDKYNGDVSKDPKVHFNEMDAFRFLEGTSAKFDLIVNEPSNPWVAGVENLYTVELYDLAKRKLNPGGLYVQWLQAYSFNDDLFKMVLRTITSRFPNVSVFQMMEHDFLLVASMDPFTRADLQRAQARVESNSFAKHSLEDSGISSFETLLALELIPYPLTPLLGGGMPLQRLETPHLSNGAAIAFYVGSTADVHAMRRELKEFYPAVEKSLLSLFNGGGGLRPDELAQIRISFCDNQIAHSRVLCAEALMMEKFINPVSSVDVIYDDIVARDDFRSLASFSPNTEVKGFSEEDLGLVQKMFDIYKRFYSPIARIGPDAILKKLDGCLRWVAPAKELYGDCLLEKAAILEVASPTSPQFRISLEQFRGWFANLSADAPDFTRFKRAADLLVKVEGQISQPAVER